MTIGSGSRLGPYEILAPLGAGGMGEVYRARDPKLGREVAIKVLPADIATDPARRQRFEQEARSASALNHPAIVTIYDVGSADGVTYIAMELVEGRTLRELVAEGPVSSRKLLEIGAQAADGLAKAHAAGIVHRDLKPENLMVTRDGFVKILDFGLAKLVETPSREVSSLPTAVAPPTEPGTVLGTTGYMSPEQAAGRGLDFRSDQFSLGAILYEMATGRRAFQRKTGAETLVAIMREEPDPVGQSSPGTPAPVRWIVERCLAKDPEDRYASTKDLARDLASVRDHLSEAAVSGATPLPDAARPRRRGWVVPAVLALLAGAGLALAARALLGGRPDAKLDFRRLTYRRGTVVSARFAPDGDTVVYAAAWDGQPLEIFSTRMEGFESRPLGLAAADVLSISSTGEMAVSLNRRFLLGLQAAGTLARVPLSGGAPREILQNVQDADWSPDGKDLAVVRYEGNRCRLEYPIGHVIYEPAAWVSHVRISPDGRRIAFFDHPSPGDNVGRVRIVDTAGKTLVEGPEGGTGLAWSARGDEVWSTPPLKATSLSGRVRAPWTLLGAQDAIYDVSRRGRVLLTRNSSRREIIGASAGAPERNLTALNYSFPIDFSADGKLALVVEQNVTPYGIYVRKLDGSPAVLLGEGQPYGFSPDGQWVLTTASLGDATALLLPSGAGQPQQVSLSGIASQWLKFFPDGRRLLVSGNERGRPTRLYAVDLAGGSPRPISGDGVSLNSQSPFSPDGRWIAAVGPDRVPAIYPAGPGQPRRIPGLTEDDIVIRWAADGRSFYVANPVARPGAIDLVDVDSGRRAPWREVHAPDPAGVMQLGPYMVSRDGSAYAYSYRRLLDDLYAVDGLR